LHLLALFPNSAPAGSLCQENKPQNDRVLTKDTKSSIFCPDDISHVRLDVLVPCWFGRREEKMK
jgi:hypothetical protein